MWKRLTLGAALLLLSCAGTSERRDSVFQICEGNLLSVRGVEDGSGDISRVELVLTAAASRDFALFTKENFGSEIEIKAGDFLVLKSKVLGVIRGGRIEIIPPVSPGHDFLGRLLSPPPGPCGPSI